MDGRTRWRARVVGTSTRLVLGTAAIGIGVWWDGWTWYAAAAGWYVLLRLEGGMVDGWRVADRVRVVEGWIWAWRGRELAATLERVRGPV